MPFRSRFLALTVAAAVLGLLSVACSDEQPGEAAPSSVPGPSTAEPGPPDPPTTGAAAATPAAAPLGSVH
ncbi:MAG: hypothetical protein QOD63_1802, partial [Actinomycetota bacterium]|nr:hypothetical protein [Actinomycetota bacterium]